MLWQNVAQVVAPTIATGLFGPLGGVVASIAANSLFGPGTDKTKITPQAVAERIASIKDPADVQKLKEAEAAVQKFEADNNFRFASLDAQAQQDARTMRVSALASGNKTADRLSWLVMGSFLVVAGGVLVGCGLLVSGYVDFNQVNAQTWVAISGLIGAILGYFSANAQQVVGFYFGSSAGSVAKTDQLAQTTASAFAAISRAPAATVQHPQVVRMDTPAGPVTAASGEPAADLLATTGKTGQLPAETEARWDACIAFVLEREGGFANDSADGGGATNMGITRATLASWRGEPVTEEDVRNLTVAEAKSIYRANYWNAARCDAMPPGVDLVLMDSAVMSGPSWGVRFLQEACGLRGKDVDGIVGPKTLSAVRNASAHDLIAGIGNARRAYYEGVIEHNHEREQFRAGWMSRVALAQERAEGMAQAWTAHALA